MGISATSTATTPNTSGEGRPAIQKPTPTRMPCTSAVRPMPRKTARVTSERCCQRRARRRSSMGSICTTRCATPGPSRSTKNSTNSISTKLAAVPRAPITNVPPEDTSPSSTLREPSIAQPCSWASEIVVLASIQASGRSSQGTLPSSSDSPCWPMSCMRGSSLRSRCAACAATAPAIPATGSMNSSTVASSVIELARRSRPPMRAASFTLSGASNEPSSSAHASGCHSGVTMRQTT